MSEPPGKESPVAEHPLAGQTALVTGASQRLGRTVALALARERVNVVVHFSKSRQAAELLVQEIAATGVNAWAIGADLLSPQQAGELFGRAAALAGPIDILVNNASIFEESRLTDFTPEALARNMQVNATSPLLLARAFAAQERRGSIVNFLDARMVDYDHRHAAYHVSKRMLHSLTMMALEFAPRVRVNAVAPGLILPPAGRDETYLQELASTNPLNTYGRPADIAEAVLFLLKSTFVTGQVIFVDGGRHLKGCVYG